MLLFEDINIKQIPHTAARNLLEASRTSEDSKIKKIPHIAAGNFQGSRVISFKVSQPVFQGHLRGCKAARKDSAR